MNNSVVNSAFQFAIGGTLVVTLLRAVRCRQHIMPTSLVTAWAWALAGLGAWFGVWVATIPTRLLQHGMADQAWYLVAVLAVGAPIAVLGAKRPGIRVWWGFVLLPMVLVLEWPAIAVWTSTMRGDPLQLETPSVLGFGLVMVMGIGNYVGTRYSLSALLLATALILVVGPLSVAGGDAFPSSNSSRQWATLCVGVSFWLANRAAKQAAIGLGGRLDRVWLDFRDSFGIVWARRLQDRINVMAQQQKWPVRLTVSGFVWTGNELDSESRAKVQAQVEQSLRWLLRRFVDPEWIDARLQSWNEQSPARDHA